MTLTEFLTARYDEAEAVARAASPSPWKLNDEENEVTASNDDRICNTWWPGGYWEFAVPNGRHIAVHDPAAILADLAVKRELLDLYDTANQMPRDAERYDEWKFAWVILNKIVLMEATRYADHPDYDPGWKRP